MENTAVPVDSFHRVSCFGVNSELNPLPTFSSLLLEGQILHGYILLRMQSRGSDLAQTGAPPVRASLRPDAWASPESIRSAVPAYSKQLRI